MVLWLFFLSLVVHRILGFQNLTLGDEIPLTPTKLSFRSYPFLVYMNDLCKVFYFFTTITFADYANLSFADRNTTAFFFQIIRELNKLCAWFKANTVTCHQIKGKNKNFVY